MRPLGGERVVIRPGTSDRDCLWATFVGRYHLPPADLSPADVALIWDLGANVGLTAAHMAALFPRAHILAIELDPQNADVCRTNLMPWRQRCDVMVGAVWPVSGHVQYARRRGHEDATRVVERRVGAADDVLHSARTIPLNELMQSSAAGVDYVKMDIEGAERHVLRAETAWTRRVRCIKVEVHPPYSVSECAADLRALGFTTDIDQEHGAAVLGRRRVR